MPAARRAPERLLLLLAWVRCQGMMALMPRMMRCPEVLLLLPLLLALLAVAGAGCGSGPGYPFEGRPMADRTLRVELLDPYFVLADGERLPRDRFLYRMREECRELRARGEVPPRVVLVW